VFRAISTTVNTLNVVNRHYKPLLKCAGFRDIRWHDLRHTCATLLLGRRVHSNWLSIFCIFWGTPA
jgi:integrase